MKRSFKLSTYLFLMVLFTLVPQFIILQHIWKERKLAEKIVLEQKEKMATQEIARKNLSLISKKTINLEKNHELVLHSLKENRIENLLYAAQLARKHQLIIVNSKIEEQTLSSKNTMHISPIKMVLGGSLQNFYSFLKEFSRTPKAIHLTGIVISTNPSLNYQVTWEVVSEET